MRFAIPQRQLLTVLGCAWTGALCATPTLPAINTNNVVVITKAPYNAGGDGVATNTTAIQNCAEISHLFAEIR